MLESKQVGEIGMKLTANRFGNQYVGICLEAENEAEKHQIQNIVSQLEKADADWGSWDDMEGSNGITIRAKLREKP